MEEKIVDSLVDHLQNNKCILVLGPEFIKIDQEDKPPGGSILNYLAESQFKKYAPTGNYLREDGFFFFDENDNMDLIAKDNILKEAARYYRQLPVTESYEMLAQIPFDTIVSLSPDKLIKQACDNIDKRIIYRKYTAAGFKDEPTVTGAKQDPLLYNLCGDIEGQDELLFTFDNLFKFLDMLFPISIPNFQIRLCKARSFIFLGFTYDKWYLKLIFYLIKKMRLSATQKESNYAIIDIDKDSTGQEIDFFKSHFRMIFSSENEKGFIRGLYAACEKEGLLFKDRVQKDEESDEDETEPPRYRIMYLASSPKDSQALRQGPEYFNKIRARLKGQFYLPLEPIFNLSADSLRSSIIDNDPQLIFISCHGGPDNTLILSDEDDNSTELSLEDLVGIISLLAPKYPRLECIVFSSCQSEVQAKVISKIIPYVIGMREPILEDASNIFTEGFFEGFLRKRSDLPFAFRNGILKLKARPLDGVTYENLPVLYQKGVLIPPNLP